MGLSTQLLEAADHALVGVAQQLIRLPIPSEGKKHFNVTDEPTNEPVGLSDPATFGKEVVGTVLENVTISHCSRVAGSGARKSPAEATPRRSSRSRIRLYLAAWKTWSPKFRS